MNYRYKWVLFAIMATILLSVLVVGCGQKSSVARVNNRTISRDEYISRLELTQVPTQTGQQMDAGAYVLQRMIDDELILQLAESKGVKPTTDQIDKRIAEAKRQNKNLDKILKEKDISLEQFRQIETFQQAVFNLRTKNIKVEDKEVKAYYDQHKQDIYNVPEQRQLAVIIAKSKEDADKAESMLNKGVQFATVARNVSIDKGTAANGGQLPMPIAKGQRGLPPVLAKSESAIFSTSDKKFTQPVDIGQGAYAIWQVLQINPAKTIDFKDAEYQIREQLALQKGAERNNDIGADLEKFRKSAKIDISVERYKKLLLQRDNGPAPAGAPAGQ